MTRGCLEFDRVTFVYESAAAPLFEDLSVRFPAGWTGIIGPNGSGKTTLLRLAVGELTPLSGVVRSPARVTLCPQRSDDPPEAFEAFLRATDHVASVLRGQLGLHADWAARWPTLSHGERKRSQIAAALWRRPGVLAVDEPTNHIDLEARRMLACALGSFRGIGLLVSHDRELLDRFCQQCLFIEPPAALMRPGGYSKATELAREEQEHAHRALAMAKREAARLRREASDRRRRAARSDRVLSKRGVSRKDHDARAKRQAARAAGKRTSGQGTLRQTVSRLRRCQSQLADLHAKKRQRMGITLHGARARRDLLFRLRAGTIELGAGRRLAIPELSMAPEQRVALIGPNGGGKSTLVRRIVSRLDLPEDKVVYLAQEIERPDISRMMASVRRLSNESLAQVISVVSRLGSQPERLMETSEPSAGEVRKIALALGISRSPHLIIMDEPTNHLDLPSIECLENALEACSCGLLLVSHDLRFLRRLTRTRWEITADEAHPVGTQMRLRVSDAAWGPLVTGNGMPS